MTTQYDAASLAARRAPRPIETAQPPRRLLGNWQLDQLAGNGTLTQVYFARPLGCPPDWPADYAIKKLKPEHQEDPVAIDLLRREAEVGRQVSEKHLVPILETRLDKPPFYLVMPRLQGVALDRALASAGRMIVPHALWIARQIAQGLKQLHAHGWVHADVKPANVIVTPQGHATLVDLGCCLRRDEAILSWDRPIVGTLHYIAPEMLVSTARTDARSDIYSLGISLFQMLSGQLPFPLNEPQELVEAHLRRIPPDLCSLHDDIPSSVGELVQRMLAKQPLRRPQDAETVIDALIELEMETLELRFAAD